MRDAAQVKQRRRGMAEKNINKIIMEREEGEGGEGERMEDDAGENAREGEGREEEKEDRFLGEMTTYDGDVR